MAAREYTGDSTPHLLTDHVCGLSGYNVGLGDTCEACDDEAAERRRPKTVETRRGYWMLMGAVDNVEDLTREQSMLDGKGVRHNIEVIYKNAGGMI